MRVETIEHALRFVPCEGDDLANACRDYEALAPIHFRGVESLYRLTVEGYFTAEQVCFNVQPAFVLWWSKSIEGSLCIHAVQSLQSKAPIQVLFLAGDKICQREACNSIVVSSTRQGMVKLAMKHGYKFHSLTMRKE